MKELSDIAVEVSEFEYFADDFPVIYKKFKLKRKQRKEQRSRAVRKEALAGRAYGRLVAWFRRLTLQDTGLRLQAAFRNWHLVSHPEAALALAHQRSSLESFTSLTVGEKPEENEEGEGEGTTRLAPAIQIGAVKGGRRAGLVSPANSRPGSAGHPFGLPPPGSGGGGGSREGRRDIYDLLNEPRELRLVPPEVLFEDYLAGYVRNTQERSKRRDAGPTFPEEYRHRRRRPEHWQR
uniref:Uncharacterized protein n=1 Tax=Heterosigma akashiwo TaxID=2829 RepID=A0A7S3XUX0_HETAK